MREIIFRGKRIDTGEWVYGDLIHERYGTCIQFIITVNPRGEGAPERKPTIERHKATIDPATVGQYTGLKDKNGKEIYEGDIVNTWIEGTIIIDGVTTKGYSHELMTVEFVTTNERLGRFVVIDSLGSEWSGFSNTAIEVIGNVWEDGGLLNDC